MNKVSLLLIIIASFTLVFMTTDGINASPVGSGNEYEILVRSSLIASIVLPLMTCICLLFPRVRTHEDHTNIVGVWRRFFAYYIDSWLVIGAGISLAVLPTLWIEWYITGEYNWSFTREFFRKTDLLIIPLAWCIFWGMFYYFYKCAKMNKATVGQFIMGYKIVAGPSDGKVPNYIERVFGGLFGLAFCPITFLKFRKSKDGIFWWDEQSNTRAVRTKS